MKRSDLLFEMGMTPIEYQVHEGCIEVVRRNAIIIVCNPYLIY